MARDGSGNFSLVAGNPVVTGTTITITWANSTLSDIATALTGSVARDGQAAMTGPLNMGSNGITSVTTIVASGAITAASLIPTSSVVPANGMYLSAANVLAFATNSVQRATIDASGNLVITGSLTAVNAVLSGSISAVGATLTGTITVGGVNVTDFARLSQSNTFTGATQTITAAGACEVGVVSTNTSDARVRLGTNSATRGYLIAAGAAGNGVAGSAVGDIVIRAEAGAITLSGNAGVTAHASISSSGVLTTPNASASEVGFKGLPRTTSAPNPGECRAISAGVTINTGLGAGQFYSYYNDSAAQVTLTKGTVTNLRLAGTTSDGNRTIEARGIAMIWANSATEFIVSGPGVG